MAEPGVPRVDPAGPPAAATRGAGWTCAGHGTSRTTTPTAVRPNAGSRGRPSRSTGPSSCRSPLSRSARLRVRLWGDRPRRLLADDSYAVCGREVSRTILLDPNEAMRSRRRLTWAPTHPRLIDAELALEDADGHTIDRVESYWGLRSVAPGDGRFLLNGQPVFMRFVLGQNYWPDTHLAAPSADALRDEVLLARSFGFNGVRIHQKIEDPRFLYWCDKLGMMVWGEAANAYVHSPRAAERLTAERMAAVNRTRHRRPHARDRPRQAARRQHAPEPRGTERDHGRGDADGGRTSPRDGGRRRMNTGGMANCGDECWSPRARENGGHRGPASVRRSSRHRRGSPSR